MKIKFITTIYSDLYGSKFGGRSSRKDHYRFSLLSLLKMTDADFICYTSEREIESLKKFFYVDNNISTKQLNFEIYDLTNSFYSTLINDYKNLESIKKGDRCFEIQYSKIPFFFKEDMSYDYYYWIDAGLSHTGIIPNKYLSGVGYERYFESSLFNNTFLKNLVKYTDDKFFIIGKENVKNFWENTVNKQLYKEYDNSYHIIGGLFGGKKELWNEVFTMFDESLKSTLFLDKKLYFEEHILSLIYCNNKEIFKPKKFDVWQHADNYIGGIVNFLNENKSFYKILEELNNE
jgi:hypothetical protein